MSHIRVKTTFEVEVYPYGNLEKETIYCHHNNGNDSKTFYDSFGNVLGMTFWMCSFGYPLWDAINLLFYPFEDDGETL